MSGSIGVVRPWRRSMFLAALAGWALIAAPSASAAVSCYYFDPVGDSPPRIQVTYDATADIVSIVRSGDLIHVNGGTCTDGSTEGTVSNTDYVSIAAPDQPIGDIQATISLVGGEFEPGYDFPDQFDANEVLFSVTADPPSFPSTGDVLKIVGAGGAEDLRFGLFTDPGGSVQYVNLDASEGPYVDISSRRLAGSMLAPSIDEFRFVGGAGADKASGRGGAGTGAPVSTKLILDGQGGADVFVGGTRSDVLRGRDQADTLKGSDGNDLLVGGPGADLLVGGPGRDTCRGGPGADILRSCEA